VEHWPQPEFGNLGVRSDAREWSDIEFQEKKDFSNFSEQRFANAIASVLARWLEKSRDVVFIGEEVGNAGGLLHEADKKYPEIYSDQIFNTPISEAGFIGLSCGAAMSGIRPIVEIMYPNFSLVAADQLFNQIALTRYMYGGTVHLPIVVRTKVAIGFGYGGQHSLNPVALFSLFPGWRIVAPSNSFDYIGLFNSAMQSLDPVLIIEYRSLYNQKFPVPIDKLDYFVEMGQANLVMAGEHVTVITYGAMVGRCTRLSEHLAAAGISIELIDLRTLDPWGIDYDTIGDSLRKTGCAVVVEEAAESQGICRIVSSNITDRFFELLNSPVACITCRDVNPVSRVLESAALISDKQLFEVIASAATSCQVR
jgi:2-oxoisovalerate dehydrogenase E1 component